MAKDKLRQGFWQEKYDEDSTPWDLGEVSPAVLRLVERGFPPTGSVVIPGCGRGYEALFLAEKGYDVTAIDFAEAPLAALWDRMTEAGTTIKTLQTDALALADNPPESYDVLLEQTFLCAIDPSLHQKYEKMAHGLLKPGGVLLGVFMEVSGREGPPYHCPPELVDGLLSVPRWRHEWSEPLPHDERRPGPEYLAAFTRLQT